MLKQNRSKQNRLLGPFQSLDHWICRACHDRCKLSSSDAAKIACHRWMMTINHWKPIGNRKGWSPLPFQKWASGWAWSKSSEASVSGNPKISKWKTSMWYLQATLLSKSPKFEENISWWFILSLPNLCTYVCDSFCVLSSVNVNIWSYLKSLPSLPPTCCARNGAGAGARRTRPNFPRRKGGRSSSCASSKHVVDSKWPNTDCTERITTESVVAELQEHRYPIPTGLWRSFCDLRSSDGHIWLIQSASIKCRSRCSNYILPS